MLLMVNKQSGWHICEVNLFFQHFDLQPLRLAMLSEHDLLYKVQKKKNTAQIELQREACQSRVLTTKSQRRRLQFVRKSCLR